MTSHSNIAHLIHKTTNVMQLGAIVFIIPWKALSMFRVLFTPIIRSVLKPYTQLLVQSYIGMVSDPVCYKTIRSWERATPDDGCKEHPKHAECFPRNNKDNCSKLHHVGCFMN
jgi:hypothetical protein